MRTSSSTLLVAVALVLVGPAPARAMSAEVYENFITRNAVVKEVYLAAVTATLHYSARRTRLYCLAEGAVINPALTEAIIDQGLAALRKQGKYSPKVPVEAIAVEVLAIKFPCAEVPR
jgi:hypothetical protein